MKALVLGATGCIGGNILRGLKQQGADVTAAVRRHSDLDLLLELDLPTAQCDLKSPDSLLAAMNGQDVLFHAAGWRPGVSFRKREQAREAISQLRNVFDAALEAGVKRVIYTSCFMTLGRPDGERIADERDYYLPGTAADPAFDIKWMMECEAQRYARAGLSLTVMVPTFCLGPWDAKPSGGQLILDIAHRRLPFELTGEINVVHVSDVALAHIKAVHGAESGERLVVAGENIAAESLFDVIRHNLGIVTAAETVKPAVAHWFALGSELWSATFGEKNPALPRSLVSLFQHGQFVDGDRLRDRFDLPKTSAAEAVMQAIQYFRDTGKL